jgi:hypothetical protein
MLRLVVLKKFIDVSGVVTDAINIALVIQEVNISQSLVNFYQTTRHYIKEYSCLQFLIFTSCYKGDKLKVV